MSDSTSSTSQAALHNIMEMGLMSLNVNDHCLDVPLDHGDSVPPEADFFEDHFDDGSQPVDDVDFHNDEDYGIIRSHRPYVHDPMTELGNVHWHDQETHTMTARVLHLDELTARDFAFFNRRSVKLTTLDDTPIDDMHPHFSKPPIDWRSMPPGFPRCGFMSPPQIAPPPFMPPPPYNHLGMPLFNPSGPPPPAMQGCPFGMNVWTSSEKASYMHMVNLHRLKVIREQREEFSRLKKCGKKTGKKQPKKPILRRRHPEIQRQTPSRECLTAPIQKRISAITASAISQAGGFSGFCGVLKVNPLYPDCRGRVSTIKEIDGNTYFECANCGTRRRFLEEDEEPRPRR